MMIVDRREKRVERIRNQILEDFYENNYATPSQNFLNLSLNMYIKEDTILKKELYDIFFQSCFDENKVLHNQQAEVLEILNRGDNLLLSAPTSFGKTFVALEYVSRKKFSNIVFIVPTLALMNELSSKIRKKFKKEFNIVTNSFESFKEKNIFILVPERIDSTFLEKIKVLNIDLLVFDEIYKLKRKNDDDNKNYDKRLITLNKSYFDIVNKSNQVILLGPFIKEIDFQRTNLNENIVKYFSDYSPVFIKTYYLNEDKNKFVKKHIKDQTNKLIYFNSPDSIYTFCSNNDLQTDINIKNSLTEWCDKYILADWLPSKMLKKGIGIHHGNIPSFMRKYIENLYNKGDIKNMLCTSTLLEGVNTPTEQLIMYDSKLSAFQVNNLIGRVGRLDTFKKGEVFYFDKEIIEKVQGDNKYEKIDIVAETSDVDDLEELFYLNKDYNSLTQEQFTKLMNIEEKLSVYGKKSEDLKETNLLSLNALDIFLDKIDELFEKLDVLYNCVNSNNSNEKARATVARKDIIRIFMKVLPDRKGRLFKINKDSKNKIDSSVCVNSLLAFVPINIYDKINKLIKNNKQRLSNDKLNMFVDYLFHLSFNYIKYELSKINRYVDFIFDEKYVEGLSEYKKSLLELLDKQILYRFEFFNNDDNKYIKILLDIGIPYADAKKIEKNLRKSILDDEVSTGSVYDYLEKNKEAIAKTNLDDVTKDLLKIIL